MPIYVDVYVYHMHVTYTYHMHTYLYYVLYLGTLFSIYYIFYRYLLHMNILKRKKCI